MATRTEHDFAGWLASVLARVAADLGSSDALTARRPGSWEASLVQQLTKGTVGWEDQLLDEHKDAIALTSGADHCGFDNRLIVLVEDVADQCRRVITNGPEPHYADERLSFGFRRLAAALVLVGRDPIEVRDAATIAADEEIDRL